MVHCYLESGMIQLMAGISSKNGENEQASGFDTVILSTVWCFCSLEANCITGTHSLG